MYAPPPKANLLVIRSTDIERAKSFYEIIGLLFGKEKHGNGPEHYSSGVDGFVFEIYPLKSKDKSTANLRFGFKLDCVDEYLPALVEIGAEILESPHDTSWGRRAVIRDLDDHTVELLC
ncbi:VOC family protein [Aliikangiella maris]|uniref:VOC family protein n=2 Tax=Aliikangiella maris TaxID=3162458 RepID=A0ABV2C0E6_9GAMM